MRVIPAIDLRGGLCVRLRQGDYDRETVFGDDPAAMAARWESEGATLIHLVDLDGAKAGRPVNVEPVRRILAPVKVPCQLGGGVRDEATIAAWLDAGVERVIVGTQALRDPDWFRPMIEAYPGRLVLGPRRPRRARSRPRAGSRPPRSTPSTLAAQFDDLPLAAIIYTDIARDGMLEGPNLDATGTLAETVQDARDRLGRRRGAGGPGPPGGAADRRLHRRAGPLRGAVHAGRGHRPARVPRSPKASLVSR